MKKLLILLSSATFITTLSNSVISCSSSSRLDKPDLSDTLKKQIEVAAKGFDKLSNYTNQEIWTSNKDEINKLVYNILQEQVAKDYYAKTMTSRLEDLGQKGDSKALADDYDNYLNELSANTLYQDYTKGYETGNYLEAQIFQNDDGSEPDVQSSNWYYSGSNSKFFVDSSKKVTTWDDTFNWKKPDKSKIAFADDPDISGIPEVSNFDYWNGIKDDINKAKTQLTTRFQTYINNYLKPSLFKNTLVDSYLQSGSYSYFKSTTKGTDSAALVRQYSPLFNAWQSWNNNDWNSNMKMVWEVVIKPGADASKWTNIYNDDNFKNLIKDLINCRTLRYSDATTGESFYDLINGFIHAIHSDYKVQIGGDNQLGNDPIFATPGYEGLYGITPSSDSSKPGTIFTANNSNADITPYKDQLTSNNLWSDHPGALLNSNGKPYNIDDNGNIVISFSMPIYLEDLINGADYALGTSDKPKDNVAHGISYTPFDSVNDDATTSIKNPISIYNSLYNGKATTENNLAQQWINMNSGIYQGNQKWSKDIESLEATKKDGKLINPTQDLFNLIESTIATDGVGVSKTDPKTKKTTPGADSGIVLNAQQALYSWAFDGDADNIYTTDLYNKIGQFIEKNE